MKHLLTILSGLLVALLFARCADDDNLSGGIDGLPERGIVIRLSTGELDTRTQLTSTGDYHHVEEVWAVLYKWNGKESTDPTTDPNNHGNYEFKSATRLNLEDGTPWNPYEASAQSRPSRDDYSTDEAYDTALDDYLEDMQTDYGGEYGNGKVQGREFVLPETNDMTNGTYRVLCIGLDDKSGKVYDLKKDDGNLNLGSTLAEAKAKMAIETKAYEGQTGTYQMYGYDGTGELFAGWTEFEFEPDNINIAEVELKRRVAGILCYVTDIPARIENTMVKGIRLCLNTKANDEIGLCRLDKPWEDFGAGGGGDASSYGGTTLAYRDLSDWEADGEILTNDEGKNLTMGVYLIPIDVVNDTELGSNFNTLSVQLFGGENYQFNEETGKVTGGELIKTFTVLNEQGHSTEETEERYNILPNYIYHIGDKDDDIDEPMSLLGQKITVKPEVWTDKEIPVEFPSVPIYNAMRLVYPTNPDDIKNTDWVGYGDNYVFDCIGIDDDNNSAYKADYYMGAPYDKRLYLEVSPSVLKDGWTLRINSNNNASDDDNDRMLYFSTKEDDGTYTYSDEGYTSEGKETVYVPLLLTSYASEDGDDTRIVTIELTPEGESTPKAFLEVKQYNAIIVTWDDGKEKRGFSREDWNGGATVQWGYDGFSVGEIFNWQITYPWGDGQDNLNYAKGSIDGSTSGVKNSDFQSSAMYYCARKFITIESNKKTFSKDWYLPARSELYYFLESQGNDVGKDPYWTSSPYGNRRAHRNYIENGKVAYGSLNLDIYGPTIERDKQYRMRPACNL